MKLAIVFAGQGSQKEQMGLDFYQKYDIFKNTIDEFENSDKLKKLCFESKLDELSQTVNTQPAMLSFAIGVYELLKSNSIKPTMVAGLSLGEYGALYASEALSKNNVMKLIQYRAKIMQEASETQDSTMFAILGASREMISEVCNEASNLGVVEICNYNSPSQIVISGERKAVVEASKMLLSRGAKKTIELNVSGAFHTSLMNEASDKLKLELEKYEFKDMQIPIIFNALGREKNPEEKIEDLLCRQIKSSVYFQDSIEYMYENGVDTIIEIGPGKALSGFVKKTKKEIKTFNISCVEDYEIVVQSLGGVDEQ